MRFLILALVLLVPGHQAWCATVPGDEAKNGILATRRVVGSVAFAENSAKLDRQAKRALDDLALRLIEGIQLGAGMIRIEGWAEPEEAGATGFELSLRRAKAVNRYLMRHHDLQSCSFLTGLGAGKGEPESAPPGRRVDIAVYQSPESFAAVSEQLVQETSND